MDTLLSLKNSYPDLMNNLIHIFIPAVLIFIIGVIIARSIRKRLKNSRFGGRHVDETLRPVLASFIFYVIMATTVYAVLIKLGVPPTSLLAIFGAAGLAIALALKDTLSNIAAGMMLLFLRPLSVGEAIEINGTVGIIEEIGLFSTTMKTPEGLYLYFPNGIIWTNRIQNYSRHKARRASVNVRVGYDTDLDSLRETLVGVLNAAPDVLSSPEAPIILVTSFENTAIHLTCRCWLPGNDWFRRVSDLHLDIKKSMDNQGVTMSIPTIAIPASAT